MKFDIARLLFHMYGMRFFGTTTVLVAATSLAALLAFAPRAYAHYPQISPIQDLTIPMNTSGPLIHFWVSDRETPADDLDLSSRSDNPALVPEDDDHITLGGRGQDRTVVITPAPDQFGFATITIVLTDNDGDKTREPFQVQIIRPPNL